MDLTPRVRRWVHAGLMTQDQADAILAFESRQAAERAPGLGPAAGRPRSLPLAAEALGYLGASLALAAAVVAVSQFWADLEPWARLTLVGLSTVLMATAGWWVGSPEDASPPVRRLASFLWFLSTAGLAFFVGLALDELTRVPTRTLGLIMALATTAYALPLWRRWPSVLQHLALFAALTGTVTSVLTHLPHPRSQAFTLAVWGLGAAWALLGYGEVVPPRRVAYTVGCVAMLAALQLGSFNEYRGAMLLLGIATSGALIWASVTAGDVILLGFGAAGIFLFVPQLTVEWFADTLGVPLTLFVIGMLLLAVALVLTRVKQRVADPDA